MKILISLTSCLLLFSCIKNDRIIDKLIVFDQQRRELTLDYLENHYGIHQEIPDITPKMIVLHWTVIPTLEASFAAFNAPTLANWRADIQNASALNVSSHFLVDRDGSIFRLMPETIMARHVIGLNHCAIGIENVGGDIGMPLTTEQLNANTWLIAYLKDKYQSIDYVIGHYEYTNFERSPLWLEKDSSYRTIKTDPGKSFMKKVRANIEHLNFKPVPVIP